MTATAIDTQQIALIGNPNSGKTTLFNALTGLNQKVGNFPGVTVDKKSGVLKLDTGKAEIIDLPGCYSLFPRSADEQVVLDVLLKPAGKGRPDAVVIVADINNLERNLLLVTQVLDLNIPVVLALNMTDIAKKSGLHVDINALQELLGGIAIVEMNARTGEGIDSLKTALSEISIPSRKALFNIPNNAMEATAEVKQQFNLANYYEAYLWLHHADHLQFIDEADKKGIKSIAKAFDFNSDGQQESETKIRYSSISEIAKSVVSNDKLNTGETFSDKFDRVITHKVYGYLIFFGLLLLIFQAIFAWSSVPMDFIDATFTQFSSWTKSLLPSGVLTDLLAEGIIPGIGGIVIFIPQIAILFAFIAILEDTGYMSRVVFLMDKMMRKVGLNGKSVVPLISGLACAIPAIMATRNIDSWKDRLITIMVTPLMSCSARLPVYTVLIALVVPSTNVLGFLNLQGLVLMAMYILGFIAAILSALLMKFIVKSKQMSFLIMEMPVYRRPRWKNVGITVVEKSKTFVFEAGKIILAVSIILWVMASYGPGNAMQDAEDKVKNELVNSESEESDLLIARVRLENSYAGAFGKMIEPVIKPLGYDWKIGIALITSFAAREVFVGTISTLYAIGEDFEDGSTIVSRMREEVNPETGQKVFTLPVAASLLLFYAFAMQCMSTIAVVYRETKGWKWPLIQTVYMTLLAYFSALIAFQILS